MKQITRELLPPVVTQYKLSSNPIEKKYYGVADGKYYSSVGFITRTNYYDGNFIVISNGGCTHGNGWDCLKAPTLKKCVEEAVSRGFVVFEFETYQELFQWLAEH